MAGIRPIRCAWRPRIPVSRHEIPPRHACVALGHGRLPEAQPGRPESEICVSPASGYEIAYKNHLGKLPLPEGYQARFSPQILSRGFQVVPVRLEHMILAGQFQTVHRDPFDRIIAAQAVVENAVLISADPQFATFSQLVTLW